MIFNIQRYSTHDGPGIRTVVFLKGCSLGCRSSPPILAAWSAAISPACTFAGSAARESTRLSPAR